MNRRPNTNTQLPKTKEELRHHVCMFKHLQNCRSPMGRVSTIRHYLERWNIEEVVVGVSGGVDSALVLTMLSMIPVKVHAVTLDFDLYSDVFSHKYIYDLQEALVGRNVEWHTHNLTGSHERMMAELGIRRTSSNVNANTTYAMRYLALFAYAQQFGAITFGTTNLDEMGYAGWFGKNSDMMVDVQPISDLHKFEVISWAEILGVPPSITSRVPTGDLLDGSSDEDNFGCTYDELSFLTYLMQKGCILNDFMVGYFAKVISLHEKNAHKYQGQNFNPVFLK